MARIKKASSSEKAWVTSLAATVQKRSLAIIRMDEEEIFQLKNSYHGLNKFSIARNHAVVSSISTPSACIIYVNGDEPVAYFAKVASRSKVSTLESRLIIERTNLMSTSSEDELASLITQKPFSSLLENSLEKADTVIPLSPKLSAYVVRALAAIEGNHNAMRTVSASIDIPKTYTGNNSLQLDAVNTALQAFGITTHFRARSLEVADGKETALSGVSVLEDSVIEHDARSVPGFSLSDSDLTGRAIFEFGGERLEVITANKRPLEKVFGVDLIYLNATKQNVVMVQYKMLEPDRKDGSTDWIYRPDGQLEAEIQRMRQFSASKPPGALEFRINPQVYYLKFVRRDAELGKSGIAMPIDHFEILKNDPACRGPKNGLRISYNTLGGRYLRQGAFIDLIRSGYIGSHSETTNDLSVLIEATLRDNRALVAAIQSPMR